MAEKKKFIDIKVPLLRTELEALGTPTSLNNKTIKLDLSRKLRGKGLNATFQIVNIEEELFAIPKKYELITSYVKKIMRKRIDYVEDSFKTQTKDNITVTIKPLLITRKRVSRAVRKRLREVTKQVILAYVKEKTYLDLASDIISMDLQKTMLPKLKKVYPLAFCDIRVFETTEIAKIDLTNINKGEEIQEEVEETEEEKETKKVEEESKEVKEEIEEKE